MHACPQTYLLSDVKAESQRRYKTYARILQHQQASKDWQDE